MSNYDYWVSSEMVSHSEKFDKSVPVKLQNFYMFFPIGLYSVFKHWTMKFIFWGNHLKYANGQ